MLPAIKYSDINTIEDVRRINGVDLLPTNAAEFHAQ